MANKIINIVPKRKVLFEKYDKMVYLEEFLISKFHESKVKKPKKHGTISDLTIENSTFYVSKGNKVLFQRYYGRSISTGLIRNELWINYSKIWKAFREELNFYEDEEKLVKIILLKYIEVDFEIRGGDSPGHSPWWKELKF